MDFKDGANHPRVEDTDALNTHVWVGDDADQDWMRSFSFTDGIDPTTGELDAGLFFIRHQRD